MAREKIIEEDETGRICRRYTTALTVIPSRKGTTGSRPGISRGLLQTLSDVFMPAGFPASVSSDYLKYQVYDSLQAFSSSIAGLLASRAVLEGVGVGDSNASATQALLLTIAQDAVGRLATIIFAWRVGTALEPEAKRYRLLADVFNDCAMILDCLSPGLPSHIRVLSLCMSGSLRALCGVAAGGAKAALSVHFARANNVGDLNAKDASQETVIGLLGMLAGSFLVSRVTSRAATWTLLLTLLAIHISTNYLAVRAIVMHTLSRQRTNIAYESFRISQKAPSPSQVSEVERIFMRGDIIRVAYGHRPMGRCEIGIMLHRLLSAASHEQSDAGINAILDIFSAEQYILWFLTPPRVETRPSFGICLKKDAVSSDQLKSWVHAIELAHAVQDTRSKTNSHSKRLHLVASSLRQVNIIFPQFLAEMTRVGWDIENPALMVRPSYRISIVGSKGDVKKQD